MKKLYIVALYVGLIACTESEGVGPEESNIPGGTSSAPTAVSNGGRDATRRTTTGAGGTEAISAGVTMAGNTTEVRTPTAGVDRDDPVAGSFAAGMPNGGSVAVPSVAGSIAGGIHAGAVAGHDRDDARSAGGAGSREPSLNVGGSGPLAGGHSRAGAPSLESAGEVVLAAGMMTGEMPSAGVIEGGTPELGGMQAPRGDCLSIDKLTGPDIFPPAGVRLGFRLLDCDGRAVRPLEADEITIINDESGAAFGAGGGGRVSRLGKPSSYGVFTVLALDFSDSIFNSNAVANIIAGARTFVTQRVTNQPQNLKHYVMIMAFGRTATIEVVQDFTQDHMRLQAALETLSASGPRGATDVYNAYMTALNHVNDQGAELSVVDLNVVLLTDGTHEVGDEDNLRAQALLAKEGSSATIYTLAVGADFDEDKLRELATSPQNYVQVDNSEEVIDAFSDLSETSAALSRSHYVIGVCTPVALGEPSMTIRIVMDDAVVERRVMYPTAQLTGNPAACDPVLVSGDYERVCEAATTSCDENTLVTCDEWGAAVQRTNCEDLPGVCLESACVESVCGDSRHDPSEGCDDGNRIDTDACTNACEPARCGDSITGPGEECDDGNENDDDGCTNECRRLFCGDGIVQVGEECDDGNDEGRDGCDAACGFECRLPATVNAPQSPAARCGSLSFGGGFPVHVDAPYAQPAACKAITMEAWVNTVAHGGGRSRYILDSRDNGRSGFGMNVDADGIQCWVSGVGENVDFNATFPMGRWAHIACVYDGEEKRVYVDGQLVASKGYTRPIAWGTGGPIRFGQSTFLSNNEQFVGQMDEVRISTVARYAANFEPAERFEPDAATLGLWHFDEGAGRTANDWSGHGSHGDFINNVGWSDECAPSHCGDGVVSGHEECDDGNDDNSDDCTENCRRPFCGDGLVHPTEACDDGNLVDNDDCTNVCTQPRCGDLILQSGEECDDGNDVNTDACTNECRRARCQDGIVRDGNVEACDDGNNIDTDVCTNACRFAVCGDGVTQTGVETCDDGNRIDTDACTNACEPARCGDSVTGPGEECDDGNENDDDGCTNECRRLFCGDGIVQVGEECDDGNEDGLDGCDAACGFECRLPATLNAPQSPAARCGSLSFGGGFPVHVDAPYAQPAACKAITMEAWVNTVAHGGGRSRYILDSRDNGRSGFGMNVDADGIQCWVSGVGENVDFNATFPMGRWAHIACVYDGEEKRVYVDGQLVASKGYTRPIAWGTGGPIRFGQSTFLSNNEQFVGQMDEVRISTVARYAANFEPAERFEPDAATLGLWHFDEGAGRTANDWSGHGSHGDFINNVGWSNSCPN